MILKLEGHRDIANATIDDVVWAVYEIARPDGRRIWSSRTARTPRPRPPAPTAGPLPNRKKPQSARVDSNHRPWDWKFEARRFQWSRRNHEIDR
jgi:hypothetical protein